MENGVFGYSKLISKLLNKVEDYRENKLTRKKNNTHNITV